MSEEMSLFFGGGGGGAGGRWRLYEIVLPIAGRGWKWVTDLSFLVEGGW